MKMLRLIVGLAALLLPALARGQSAPADFMAAARYDDAARVVGTIAPDPDGSGPLAFAALRNTYDAAGRLIRVEKGELASWQAESIAPSAWTGFTVFSKVETSYDQLDRKTLVAVWGYDSATSGWVQSAATQFSYDKVGRSECTAVRMNPATWSALPASACDLATTSSAFGPDRITRNVYDDGGQLLRVVKAYGITSANGFAENLQQDYATYTYTDNGKQKTLTDANGNKTTYTYDGFDRLIAWAFPSKTTTGTSASCTMGAVTETTDGFSNTVAGPSESRSSGDDCEKYAYDGNGNRAKLMKRDGSVIRYAYDALNRNTIKDIPDSTSADVYFGYDARGLQTYARFASASGVGITTSYDGFGRVSSTTNDMGASAQTLSYLYDANGNRTRLTYPDSSFITYSYDGLDRLTAIREQGTTVIVSSIFDARGQLSSQTRGVVTTTLNYDPTSRPASWTDDLAGTTSDVTSTFAFSPANQMVTKTRSNNAYAWTGYVSVSRDYAVNGLNQYTSGGSASFTYDANGNLTGDGSSTYAYDVENRMIGATITGVSPVIKYDPLGRLWQIVVLSKTLTFTHDGDAIVAEANVITAGGTTSTRYVHGPGDDDPMIQYSTATSGATTRYSLQQDYLGSIVSLADASGAKYTINAYDEYGITIAFNGRFGFTGQAWIPQLGLYYYKARMYSPTLGRFMQTDPIGYEDQTNLYAYVANDPVNRKDPTGLESQVICRRVYGVGNHCFIIIINDKNQITDRFSYGPEKVSCALCDKGRLVETKGDRDSPTDRSDEAAARTGDGVTARTSLNQFGVTDGQVRKAGQAMDAQLGSTEKPGNTNYSLWSSSSNTAAAGVVDKAQPGLSGKVDLGTGVTPGWPNGGAPKPNPGLDQYLKCVNSGSCK